MTLPLQPTWWLDSIRPLPMTFTYATLTRIILGPQLALTLAVSDLWSKANTWPEDILDITLISSVLWMASFASTMMPCLSLTLPWSYLGWRPRHLPGRYAWARPALLSMSWLRPPPFDVHCSDCCVCKLHMTNNGLWIIDHLWHSMTTFTLTLILNWIHLTLWPWKSISFLDMCLTPHTWPFPCLYSLIITGPSFIMTSKGAIPSWPTW